MDDQAAPSRAMSSSVYSDPNFPLTHDKRVHHLDVKAGEDLGRAERIAGYLDDPAGTLRVPSKRGFVTITGTFKGIPVSIVGTGMGIAMMDFVVRETRAVVDGPMAIVRFGSSGGISSSARPGNIVVATDGACSVVRDPEGFLNPSPSCPPYRISSLLDSKLRSALGSDTVVHGVNVTADTFYSSQARIGTMFDDRNANLLDRIHAKYPSAACMEMETFHLLDLAYHSHGTIRATAAAIVLANRKSAEVLDEDSFARLESVGGKAMLEVLAEAEL